MTPVKSSNIEAVGYDLDSQVMTVRFRGGTTHSYADVPPECHEKFMAADSIGSHFHANIKNLFKSTKVEKDAD